MKRDTHYNYAHHATPRRGSFETISFQRLSLGRSTGTEGSPHHPLYFVNAGLGNVQQLCLPPVPAGSGVGQPESFNGFGDKASVCNIPPHTLYPTYGYPPLAPAFPNTGTGSSDEHPRPHSDSPQLPLAVLYTSPGTTPNPSVNNFSINTSVAATANVDLNDSLKFSSPVGLFPTSPSSASEMPGPYSTSWGNDSDSRGYTHHLPPQMNSLNVPTYHSDFDGMSADGSSLGLSPASDCGPVSSPWHNDPNASHSRGSDSGSTYSDHQWKNTVASDSLRAAAERRRKKEAKHFCQFCGAGFTQKHNRLNHERSHKGEKLYGCDVCEARFGTKSVLNRHAAKCCKSS